MPKEVRLREIKVMPIAKLKPHPRNPREIKDGNFDALKAGILAGELWKLPTWNKRNGLLVTGHQTVRALTELGVERVQVNVVDKAERDHLRDMLQDNNPHVMGHYTEEAITIIDELAVDHAQDVVDLKLDEVKVDVEYEVQTSEDFKDKRKKLVDDRDDTAPLEHGYTKFVVYIANNVAGDVRKVLEGLQEQYGKDYVNVKG